MQKYERGSNRISASKIYQAAWALKVPVPYFFEGLHEGEEASAAEGISSGESAVQAFLNTGEGIELAEAFPRITSARQRRQVLDRVKSLVDD
ncbi:Cro/Cl family transcriptional regulator [Asticcacaulis sp. YBE204]|nr:Cro/Cl family transcriptional regulator [Asticcacaulis sp. YBE204]